MDYRVVGAQERYFLPLLYHCSVAHVPLTVLPFLRLGYPHLRTLDFYACFLQEDDGIGSVLDALVQGKHYNLESLGLEQNFLTSQSLVLLYTVLDPSVFSCLETIILADNDFSQVPVDIIRHFVDLMLLSNDTVLKRLDVAGCGNTFETVVIKALETNHTLRWLKIETHRRSRNDNSIRSSLVESLPKMKGLQELDCGWALFEDIDQELVTAFYTNTSLLKLPVVTPPFGFILTRNRKIHRRNNSTRDQQEQQDSRPAVPMPTKGNDNRCIHKRFPAYAGFDDGILCHVASFIDLNDTGLLAQVSKRFRQIGNDVSMIASNLIADQH
jgi:hypothetical protein